LMHTVQDTSPPLPQMFALSAGTNHIACPSRPWVETWRSSVQFDYNDFDMDFYCVPKTHSTWEAFVTTLRGLSHGHRLRVLRHPECSENVKERALQRDIGTCPAHILWQSCNFGAMRWSSQNGEEEVRVTLPPEATHAEVISLLETTPGLPASICPWFEGRLGDMCIPNAFDPITDWMYFDQDCRSFFQVGFGTATTWYWVWSASS
jgi:hypothetical protein